MLAHNINVWLNQHVQGRNILICFVLMVSLFVHLQHLRCTELNLYRVTLVICPVRIEMIFALLPAFRIVYKGKHEKYFKNFVCSKE